MNKYEVAQILYEMGILIELQDPYPMKGVSYKRAARSIENVEDLKQLVKEKNLESLPGIGQEISRIVTTLVKKGKLPYYEKLKKGIPESVFELLQIPGMSVSKVRKLYESGVKSLSSLDKAIREKTLRGISPYFFKKLKKRVHVIQSQGFTLPYYQVEEIGHGFQATLGNVKISGDVRRKLELVSELRLLGPRTCRTKFVKHRFVKKVLKKEKNKIQVVLKQGIRATLYTVTEENFAFTLFSTTGNERHVEKIKKEAQKKKVQLQKVKEEKEIYISLKMQYIPPELRENKGEITAAKKWNIPRLIELDDLKGTFHCHTTYSDGHSSLENMVKAARDLGWEYLGISDHSKSSTIAHGMKEEKLFEQIDKIDRLNKKTGKNFRVFSGLECDILKDGSLDFSNDILKQLDFVIISIHKFFRLEKDVMTKRLIRAIENPYTTIVGHLTGRLLRYRDPYEIDINKIIDACIANEKVIELNGYPSRLEMDWRYWHKAKEKGLKCSINPDAHSAEGLLHCRFGVDMARKGWLEKSDVINTFSLEKMRLFLEKK